MPPLQRKLLLILLLIPFFSMGQYKEGTVAWSPDRKLSWKDYEAQPDPNSDAAASTTTYLGIEYNFTSKGFGYSIECNFSRNKSWGLHKTDYILEHEQGHFDIAEYFARKLNMKMKSYLFNRATYERDLKKIYQDVVDEKEDLQDQYDLETNHSINEVKQAEWLKKIEKMLEELKDYSGY